MSSDGWRQLVQALWAACESDPGLWNLVRAEHEWSLYGMRATRCPAPPLSAR
jgi:hypothetical protein